MSKFSKAQEDRVERKLREIGFKLIEDTARRRKHAGDRIMEHVDTGVVLTLDHKSTIGERQITLKRADLEKIRREAVRGSIPALTFSFKNSQEVYIAFPISELEGVLY